MAMMQSRAESSRARLNPPGEVPEPDPEVGCSLGSIKSKALDYLRSEPSLRPSPIGDFLTCAVPLKDRPAANIQTADRGRALLPRHRPGRSRKDNRYIRRLCLAERLPTRGPSGRVFEESSSRTRRLLPVSSYSQIARTEAPPPNVVARSGLRLPLRARAQNSALVLSGDPRSAPG